MKLVVLTGAGMSAESGLRTFRDSGGLWEGYDVMQVASIEGWRADPALVLNFYNERRAQLNHVEPNKAHFLLAQLEATYEVKVITQNVDNLHERAGSSSVIHLHGELTKMSSESNRQLVYPCEESISIGDLAEDGCQLRPDIVWFGEPVPRLELAVHEILQADLVFIVGTSMQVYPAASLIQYAPSGIPIYYIDPSPSINYELRELNNLTVIEHPATVGVDLAIQRLNSNMP